MNNDKGLEAFIDFCDDCYIAEEGTAWDITKVLYSTKKKIKKLNKKIKECENTDPKSKLSLLKELESLLVETKTTIQHMPDTEDETWRKVVGWICILCTPIFVGLPVGIKMIKSVHSKRDALNYIDGCIENTTIKIKEMQSK